VIAERITGAGLIILRDDKVLLLLRSGEVDNPGTWNIPMGAIELGELAWQAAIRETKEECGSVPSDIITHEDKIQFNGFLAYVVRTNDQKWKPQINDESSDYQWFDFDNLPEPLHPATEGVLEQWTEQQQNS
jgi:8-oxo-dGTP diphosphatase